METKIRKWLDRNGIVPILLDGELGIRRDFVVKHLAGLFVLQNKETMRLIIYNQFFEHLENIGFDTYLCENETGNVVRMVTTYMVAIKDPFLGIENRGYGDIAEADAEVEELLSGCCAGGCKQSEGCKKPKGVIGDLSDTIDWLRYEGITSERVPGTSLFTAKTDELYVRYAKWCYSTGYDVKPYSVFKDLMRDLGFCPYWGICGYYRSKKLKP